MHQIKLFADLESNLAAMEAKINDWLQKSGARVVNIFGNIAPQTATLESKSTALAERKFSSSDVFIAVVYEQT